jgi:peptide/nickel transport system permease protein
VRVLAKRFGLMLFLIWLTVTVTFFLIRLIPGNPVKLQLMTFISQGMTYQEALRHVELLYGYNIQEPLWSQYLQYIGGLVQGKLGHSLLFPNDTNLQLIEQTLPWTVFTVATAILVSFVIGVVLGTIAAYRRGGWLDQVMTPGSSILNGLPNYLVGTVLLYFFAVRLQWFPTDGAYSPTVVPGFNFPFIGSVLDHAVLPIGSYVVAALGGWYLLMRSNTVSVLNADFIAGARSHGVSENTVMLRYVAPNAILPLVTNVVLSIAFHFGGSVFVETIFNYPGIGYLFGQASANSDYSLLQALFGVLAVIVIVANFITDILYTVIDPRIKLEDIA